MEGTACRMQLDVDRSEDFECFLAYAEAQAQLDAWRAVNK